MSSNTTATTHVRPVRTGWWFATRAIAGLFGAQLLAGATYFTFFASPADGGVDGSFDWFVAVWAMIAAVAFVVVAIAPRLLSRDRESAVRWIVLVHALWGTVKLVAYDELVPSLISLAADGLIVLLAFLAHRPK